MPLSIYPMFTIKYMPGIASWNPFWQAIHERSSYAWYWDYKGESYYNHTHAAYTSRMKRVILDDSIFTWYFTRSRAYEDSASCFLHSGHLGHILMLWCWWKFVWVHRPRRRNFDVYNELWIIIHLIIKVTFSDQVQALYMLYFAKSSKPLTNLSICSIFYYRTHARNSSSRLYLEKY